MTNIAAALADITVFRQYILAAVRQVFEKVTATGDELTPVCFIVTDEGTALMPVTEFFRNDTTKRALMETLAEITKDPKVKGIALVNEIWTATLSAAEVQSDDFVRPMDRPDRGEAAMIRLEFRGFGPEIWTAPIAKSEGGRVLAEFSSAPFESGLMTTSLFPTPALPN